MKSDTAGNQKDVWQIFQPIWDIIIGLSLLFLIVHDIAGLQHSGRGGRKGSGPQGGGTKK